MSKNGCFNCYNTEQNIWIELSRIGESNFEFQKNGLVILENTVFYVS